MHNLETNLLKMLDKVYLESDAIRLGLYSDYLKLGGLEDILAEVLDDELLWDERPDYNILQELLNKIINNDQIMKLVISDFIVAFSEELVAFDNADDFGEQQIEELEVKKCLYEKIKQSEGIESLIVSLKNEGKEYLLLYALSDVINSVFIAKSSVDCMPFYLYRLYFNAYSSITISKQLEKFKLNRLDESLLKLRSIRTMGKDSEVDFLIDVVLTSFEENISLEEIYGKALETIEYMDVMVFLSKKYKWYLKILENIYEWLLIKKMNNIDSFSPIELEFFGLLERDKLDNVQLISFISKVGISNIVKMFVDNVRMTREVVDQEVSDYRKDVMKKVHEMLF